MPTFGISDLECEGDLSYEGHDDLLFKKLLFETVRPLERLRCTAAHTFLSKKLRENSAVSRARESKCVYKDGDERRKRLTWTTECPYPTQPTVKVDADCAEEIAEYYIQKASAQSRRRSGEKRLSPVGRGTLRKQANSLSLSNDAENSSSVGTNAQQFKENVPVFQTQRPAQDQKLENNEVATIPKCEKVTPRKPLQDGNALNVGVAPSPQTPLSANARLFASVKNDENSFGFLGSPINTASNHKDMLTTLHLNTYTGSRPSFGLGTITSTPFAAFKKSIDQSGKNDEKPKENGNENVENAYDSSVASVIKPPQEASLCGASKTKEQINFEPDGKVILKSIPVNSLDRVYANEIKLAIKYDEAKRLVEEDKANKALRALTKRTIVEKVTVETKKTATVQDIKTVASFLFKLLTGGNVIGYGEKQLQLPDGDFRRYACVITIESYMGVVERDPLLTVTVSRILILLSANVPQFESLLMGKLVRTSQLLTLNEERCTSYVKKLASTEDRRFALIPETAMIKLFVHLHVVGAACRSNIAHFTSNSLWKMVTFLLDEEYRPIATAAILLEIVESGSLHFTKSDPQRWTTTLRRISDELVPKLEAQIDADNLRLCTGEDGILSSMRHAVSRRLSS
ncbi:hypothetical protein Q1695_006740 [Nippostrongylus brasiliensis]|nr:hypothetical protein Q1695_006740 [Nippostrongylus brasiliensis]